MGRGAKMITVCIPTIREQNIPKLVKTITQNAGVDDFEIDWLVDTDRAGCPETLKRLVSRAQGDLICFLGDDTLPEPDFLKHALDAMATLPDGWGVVGLNSQESKHAAHFLADKRMLPLINGEFFSTEYHHCFGDNELTEVAEEMGRYVFAEKSVVKHIHPAFKNAESDPDYDRVYSQEYYEHDLNTYRRRKRERYGFKLGIGFPVIDKQVALDFMISFTMLDKPDYTLLIPKFSIGDFVKDIAAVRNNLVEQAQNEGCSHLLMLDTDQVYRDKAMISKMLSHKMPVVGAPVHRRYPPFDAILLRGEVGKYKFISDEEVYSGDLIEIDATGTGCVLLDMTIFDDMKQPYFSITVHGDKVVGEDIGFCSKLRSKGIPIRADTSIEIGHITAFEVNRQTWEMYCAIKGFRKAA
jgi:hypothetical protein